MKVSKIFDADDVQVAALVKSHPFANMISGAGEHLQATALPLLLEYDEQGRSYLLGHFAKVNPQVQQLKQDRRALIVFQGPHGYISPSWFDDRTQAPTWNFATVHYSVEISLFEDEASSRFAVEVLTEQMEFGRPNSWSVDDMGGRYQKLLPGIVAFRAYITARSVKFKLGQNERLPELQQSLVGLENERFDELASMMRRANKTRLE
jgi:predicted FMN-binding regulatory protein PaiB